jgi:hypothetical protein
MYVQTLKLSHILNVFFVFQRRVTITIIVKKKSVVIKSNQEGPCWFSVCITSNLVLRVKKAIVKNDVSSKYWKDTTNASL